MDYIRYEQSPNGLCVSSRGRGLVPHKLCTHIRQKCPAKADTGIQTNVRSWQDFLAASFKRDILLSAPNLAAANHSGMKIVGAFFAVIKGTSHSSSSVKCHAMIYVSDDIRALCLSRDTLSDLGVLSPNFPLSGEHQQSLALNGTTPDTKQPASVIRSITGGCVIPECQDASCSCSSDPRCRHLRKSSHFVADLRTMLRWKIGCWADTQHQRLTHAHTSGPKILHGRSSHWDPCRSLS